MMGTSFFRFLLVGIVNTLVGLTAMYALHHIEGQSYWASTFVGNTIGAIVSYFLNRTFTFKSNSPIGKSAIRFMFVILVCYFISYSLGKHLTTIAFDFFPILSGSFRTDLAILFGTGFYTITNYFGQKLFVFSVVPSEIRT